MNFPCSGIYAITQSENKTSDQVLSEVGEAIKGGVSVVQYRDKQPVEPVYLAGALKELCHAHNIPIIINDQVELARHIGADGVHIGLNDSQITYVREVLGKKAIIGVSCYDSIDCATHAQQLSADYVAFGRFFPSSTKPQAAPASLATLQQAKKSIQIPIVAIGGILPNNGAQLLSAGADLLAVIGGIFTESPYQSALAYQALIK